MHKPATEMWLTPKQLSGNHLVQDSLLDENENDEDEATATRLAMSGFGWPWAAREHQTLTALSPLNFEHGKSQNAPDVYKSRSSKFIPSTFPTLGNFSATPSWRNDIRPSTTQRKMTMFELTRSWTVYSQMCKVLLQPWPEPGLK